MFLTFYIKKEGGLSSPHLNQNSVFQKMLAEGHDKSITPIIFKIEFDGFLFMKITHTH